MGAPTLRCSTCNIDWPNTKEFFSKCAKCGEKTDVISNGSPMNSVDAVSLKNHLDFYRFCDAWDANREERLKAEGAAVRDMREWEDLLKATPSIPDPDEPDAEPAGE